MSKRGQQNNNIIMRRPVTRSRSRALEQARCNLCCREIIALKPPAENNGKKPKSRLHNVSCTSLIPRDVFEAGILKKWHAVESDSDCDGPSLPKKKRRGRGKKREKLEADMRKNEFNFKEGATNRKRKRGKHARLEEEGTREESLEKYCVELPDEIWLKIFCLVLMGGQYPTMHRLQLVCKRWNRLSRHSCLWRDVDLSCAGTRWIPYSNTSLEWLSKHRLHSVQKLNLHGWHCLTSEGLEHLARHCPKLQAVELAFCSHISREAIYTLTKNCKDLQRLNLANTTSDIVCVYPMVQLAEATGEKLRSLDLSGNLLRGFNTVLTSICENCPNLEVLDVGRCRGDLLNMDIELWQRSMPKMRVFSLSYSIFQTVQVFQPMKTGPGWPKLEELLLAMSTSGGTRVPPPINDAILSRFLHSSESLRQLDIRGCQDVSSNLLLNIPMPRIQALELGMFSHGTHEGLGRLMDKYGCQLKEVNLSWTTYPQAVIQSAVQALIRAPQTFLRLLFLARTLITVQDVRDILRMRPSIARIELKDCPNLPHEWRKLFNSESKMKRLHKMVRNYKESDDAGCGSSSGGGGGAEVMRAPDAEEMRGDVNGEEVANIHG